MHEIIENFIDITKIDRCSFKTEKMLEFIKSFSKECGYSVEVDKAGNVLATLPNPKLTLQAHYDMVCVGDTDKINIVIEDNKLYAKNSSLGADNGMAIAMMMQLMKERAQVEFLFTNNEEVGLIGAKELELKINSNKVLNLDSEDEGQLFIGCAGGVDFTITKEIDSKYCNCNIYKKSVTNLPGGHSGLDIDKGICNAILKLLVNIKNKKLYINTFNGGEAENSIPANAVAIVCQSGESQKFVEDILNYPNGLIAYDKNKEYVYSSSNIGILKVINSKLTMNISLRSQDNFELLNRVKFINNYWSNLGYKVDIKDTYPAWEPQESKFLDSVEEALKAIFKRVNRSVIHAGLECGVLSQKFPSASFASIGPNIRYPHSKKEYVEIDSVVKTYTVIKNIISST